ncbi:E3 ubiquitin-protein ligase CHIP-like [Apium graveolens]|uniref:E3 ubiquitin-protein ligase CHIP-like n=1 Tax=Apium graveolens TaxID=4045 RepID=UPI003D7AE16C
MQYDWDLGNNLADQAGCFSSDGEYFEAAHFLSKAIELRPKTALFYARRARCYVKMKKWFLAEEDCRKAIELNPHQAEAYMTLGHILRQYGELEDAIQKLQKGLDLSTRLRVGWRLIDQATIEVYKARYQVWERDSAKPLSELKILKNACLSALKEKNFELNHIRSVDAVFEKAIKAYTPVEVPSFFTCPITLSILRDPVITKCGITYERASLLQAVATLGQVDPTTRRPLGLEHLVSNLSLRQALEHYLNTHGWAYNIPDDD